MSVGCEPGLSTYAQRRTRANVNIRPRPLAQRTGKEKKRIRESEKERKRQREKKREGRRRDTGEKERRVARLQQHRVFSLKIRSPALRTMVFDEAKLESMLRDSLDEVSGLETMLVTVRARVRRNDTPFSFEAFSSKKFVSYHPVH